MKTAWIGAHTRPEDVTVRLVFIGYAGDADHATTLAEVYFYDRLNLPHGNIAVQSIAEMDEIVEHDDGTYSFRK